MTNINMKMEDMMAMLESMDPEKRAEIARMATPVLHRPWLPQEGPQTEAFYCEADEMLYGGAAGGGKTDLVIGLATTAHLRTLVFRAQSKDLDGFWSRLTEVIPNPRKSNDVKRSMTTQDGRLIEGGHLGMPGSERDWQGRPHDLIAFDEAAQLQEMRVNFVLQWLRSTTPGQRKRVVFATNPPIPEIGPDGQFVDTGLGDWLLRWFAPWVDDLHPNPAQPGEIRWCYMRAIGDRLETVWVDQPGCYDTESATYQPNATADDIEKGLVSVAKSRTFIKSLLKDNAFLKGTGYAEKLAGTPEPLKSMLLKGDFTVRGDDHPMQVVPTQWVLAAQERWNNRSEADVIRLRQLVLYADIAQGGVDTTVLAPLCETDYFDELITKPGRDTPDGKAVARMLMDERLDGSLIALDATGGWAGGTKTALELRYRIMNVEMHTVSKVSGRWESNNIYRYGNMRSEMWWEFRNALDPASNYRICLPPSKRLLTQLTTPHWYVRGKELFIESKEELRKRIGGSTDEADAVLGAWQFRDQALAYQMRPEEALIEMLNGREPRGDPNAQAQQDYEDYDPRQSW